MILRLSAKLGKKVHESPLKAQPLAADPFADWSAHVFTAARAQYVLVSNTASLFAGVMHGRGITDGSIFASRAIELIGETMSDEGLSEEFSRRVVPHCASVVHAKSLDRSVIGSMNDQVSQAKIYLAEMGLAPAEVSTRLNKCPMSVLGGMGEAYGIPKDRIRTLASPDHR